MAPSTFKAIRQRAGLTQSGLADFLRISDIRTIRKWEAGERAISGPVSLLMEMLDDGRLLGTIAGTPAQKTAENGETSGD